MTTLNLRLKKFLPSVAPIILLVSVMLILFWVSGAEATSLDDGTFKPLGDVTIPEIIGKVINGILGLTGVIALLMFVYGGVSWMLSQGNTEKVSKAKNIIIWSVLGIIIIFASYSIVGLVVGQLGQS